MLLRIKGEAGMLLRIKGDGFRRAPRARSAQMRSILFSMLYVPSAICLVNLPTRHVDSLPNLGPNSPRQTGPS